MFVKLNVISRFAHSDELKKKLELQEMVLDQVECHINRSSHQVIREASSVEGSKGTITS